MMNETTLHAQIVRAKEIVDELADTGDEAHRILALANLIVHMERLKTQARAAGEELGVPDSTLHELDSEEMIDSLVNSALICLQSDASYAGLLFRVHQILEVVRRYQGKPL